MNVQIAAQGFTLTDALREVCQHEIESKINPMALHETKAKWTLSLERGESVAHLHWSDGDCSGDVTVKGEDMYGSIRQCAKKAAEQMKKSRAKKQDHHKGAQNPYKAATEDED